MEVKMEKFDIGKDIERLLNYASKENLLEELDIIYARNSLLELLEVDEPARISEEDTHSLVEILNRILNYAYQKGIIKENSVTYRDLFDTKIMNIVIKRPQDIVNRFYKDTKEAGIKVATDKFYKMSIASNYIRMDRINKNLYWETDTEFGALEITINLSKPEKDPKDIAASKLLAATKYPKCLLCLENLGFSGTLNHPSRHNLRVIPIKIQGEAWYFQYSPYVYYNEHCIVFYNEHTPMKLSYKTFEKLFDFIDQFPHYFIGSNADLPIVGGSILAHEHFQGGRHVFPIEGAIIEKSFQHPLYENVNCGIVNWPMSVIRLSSRDRKLLTSSCNLLYESWKNYSDASRDILPTTLENAKLISHNTVTPIARLNKDGLYEMDIVLRNNRANQEFPDGIFHPHKELHHIKKENIGLIEVMGLAILPERLKNELREVKDILQGRNSINNVTADTNIYKHLDWINYLINKFGVNIKDQEVEDIINREVGLKFLQVLENAGVYKRDENGKNGIKEFILSCGFKEV